MVNHQIIFSLCEKLIVILIPSEPSRLARNGIIYLSTGEDCICVQDPPPNHPAYGISDNQALRVVAAVGRSNVSIVEVEFGTVQADTVKLNKFVRDEGRETMCLKAIDYYVRSNLITSWMVKLSSPSCWIL